MFIKRWMPFIITTFNNPYLRGFITLIYYLAIIAALIAMYGKGDFSTPPFIYQGF